MNILILSVGTRNKIIQYFKKELTDKLGERKGNIVVTDMSILAPAIYEADKFYIVPRITSSNYIEKILEICKKEKISAVLSLIDPELSILSKNSEVFHQLGVQIIGSSYDVCQRSLDKYEMYKWLIEHDYNCAKSYINLNEFYEDISRGVITYPVFVKPSKGSASLLISKANNNEEVEFLFNQSEGMMIQEYLKGQEIGADVYIDMITHEVVSIFTKKKIIMRSGETDKAISFKEEKLFNIIEKFTNEAGFKGQIDVDLFQINDKYYISEVNPRFGGGYPHAYECGVNHMNLICKNIQGIANKKNIGNYETGIYMMKYNEIKTFKS